MAAAAQKFKGTGISEYAQAAQRLLDMAADLESGRRCVEGVMNGTRVDLSLAQAAELRRSADCLAEVLGKLLSYAAA